MNMKSKAKDELMNRKKDHTITGGGKPVFATPMDSVTEMISGILGHDNICVGGVAGVGGNDTTEFSLSVTEENTSSEEAQEELATVVWSGDADELPHLDESIITGTTNRLYSTPNKFAGMANTVPPCTPPAPPSQTNPAKFVSEWSDSGTTPRHVNNLIEKCLTTQIEAWNAYTNMCREQQQFFREQRKLTELQKQYYQKKL
ncbi:hypothetical protein Pcinc_023661 [Petrolisthes cinctipes]|uniref:Uncharacterized protein n=1 Tax=Petrolisthes cinctipes TaxID=88211 RepID=A0AAE1FBI6_PETCI|nr:hypothetical protein Pcinc_023661 [Petrolisthes cinctipes]